MENGMDSKALYREVAGIYDSYKRGAQLPGFDYKLGKLMNGIEEYVTGRLGVDSREAVIATVVALLAHTRIEDMKKTVKRVARLSRGAGMKKALAHRALQSSLDERIGIVDVIPQQNDLEKFSLSALVAADDPGTQSRLAPIGEPAIVLDVDEHYDEHVATQYESNH